MEDEKMVKYTDRRNSIPRKNDNVELGGQYFRITNLKKSEFEVDLGLVAPGTFVNPTPGTKTRVEEVEPDEGKISMIFIGVRPVPLNVAVDDGGAGGPTTQVRDFSCWIRAYYGEIGAAWVTPDGNEEGHINHETSPIEDPNEWSVIFLLADNKFYIQGLNPYVAAIQQYVRLQVFELTLEKLPDKPPIFTPMPVYTSNIFKE